ncbi:hypothetical protein TELCIR_14053 [Teladorsagia circumcincta]|uniref:Uncharacterized protein n=1 Tax=Teladorsagia circumcincta TaxID=45464 RepID=A0A2G9U3R1_TELCI|nr:hypothetical protein TELCIR_14053 [Teladorsagia circumcincta]
MLRLRGVSAVTNRKDRANRKNRAGKPAPVVQIAKSYTGHYGQTNPLALLAPIGPPPMQAAEVKPRNKESSCYKSKPRCELFVCSTQSTDECLSRDRPVVEQVVL